MPRGPAALQGLCLRAAKPACGLCKVSQGALLALPTLYAQAQTSALHPAGSGPGGHWRCRQAGVLPGGQAPHLCHRHRRAGRPGAGGAGHRHGAGVQAGERGRTGLGPDQVAEGRPRRHGQKRPVGGRDRFAHPAKQPAQCRGRAGQCAGPVAGPAGQPATGRAGLSARKNLAGRRCQRPRHAGGRRCRPENRPRRRGRGAGANRPGQADGQYRATEPGLHPDPGPHRRGGGGHQRARRPDGERQPDHAHHHQAGAAGHGDGEGANLRGRRGACQTGAKGVLHHPGRAQPALHHHPAHGGARARLHPDRHHRQHLHQCQRHLLQRPAGRAQPRGPAAHLDDGTGQHRAKRSPAGAEHPVSRFGRTQP